MKGHNAGDAMKRLVRIDYLSRVEGEGGIAVEIKDGRITRLHLKIFEAPRFFESFIRGRSYTDVIDFTARVCGICPVAYQMSSVHAIERIFGVALEKPLRELRRLLYAGEWIESHALHVYFLHGPDFYGVESGWASRKYFPLAKRGLGFKRLGNRIMAIIGGRSIHPVSVKVGGFYKVPEKRDLVTLLPEIERAYEESLEGIKWAANLPFTGSSLDRECVSLRHRDEYPMNEGDVVSNKGLDVPMDLFLGGIREYQVEHSTALHAGIKRDTSLNPYLVGPLARLNLNHEKLPRDIKNVMQESSIELPLSNTQAGIIARSVEIAYAFHESIRIIRDYEKPDRPSAAFEQRAGEATWITEAPRGILVHRYALDDDGRVLQCTLIPPTSQNLAMIEADLRNFVHSHSHFDTPNLKAGIEHIIRNYDPCISCSTHLLDIRIVNR